MWGKCQGEWGCSVDKTVVEKMGSVVSFLEHKSTMIKEKSKFALKTIKGCRIKEFASNDTKMSQTDQMSNKLAQLVDGKSNITSQSRQ